MRELNKQIRVVKRNEIAASVAVEKVQAERPLPVEQSVTVIVKNWVAELKERKRNERHSFAPLYGER